MVAVDGPIFDTERLEITGFVVVTGVVYVNLSPAPAVLVPFAVVTVTSTMPGVEVAGAVAVSDVSLVVAVITPAVVPKWTAVAPVRPVPVIVTAVPPAVEPVAGDIEVMVGAPDVTAEVVKLMTAPGRQTPLTSDHAA